MSSASLFRDILKDVATYGTSDVILKAGMLVALPIFTRVFSPEEYGVWNFIGSATGILSGIVILGGDSAYARYFFIARSDAERQVITTTWLSFLFVWSLCVTFIGLPFVRSFSLWAFNSDRYSIVCLLALFGVPLTLANTMCGQVLRNQFRAKLFAGLNLASAFLGLGLSIWGAVTLNLGLTGVIGGGLVAAVVLLPVRVWTIREMLRPVFSFPDLAKLLRFGIPLVPTSLAYWIFAGSDRLILGKLSTLDQLGLFAVGLTITSPLNFANSAFGQAWSPHAIRIYEEQREFAQVFFGKVLTYLLAGFGILSVGITTFSRELLMIFSTPAFYAGAAAVGPLTLGIMAYASTQITASGISVTKRTHYFALVSWTAAILNVLLNFMLVPRWGMLGTSWAMAIAYLFLTISYALISQRLWPVSYEVCRISAVVVSTVAFTVGVSFLPIFPLMEGVTVKSLYCLAYIWVLVRCGVLHRHQVTALTSALRQRGGISS